jgi:hypothetical protein
MKHLARELWNDPMLGVGIIMLLFAARLLLI